MDENNFDNRSQNNGGQYSNYQDNTGNVPNQVPIDNVPDNKANGLQIAGLVCGIIAICTSCCYGIMGIIMGIVGIICSAAGNKSNKSGVGTAGLVCSIIGLIFGVVMLIYSVWAFSYVFGSESGYWDMMRQLGY
ncbi:MAG: hypothetical protein HFH82_06005 [Lachnospiraceae bacterium]|nr:hypothetical protein [Lachnospiraceae bacterium]